MYSLIDSSSRPNQFFSILPKDWQEIIVPAWQYYKEEASIFILKDKLKVIAGGIVFNHSIPNASLFEESNYDLFQAGYKYIGYVWVVPSYRKQGLASLWLTLLKEKFTNQHYWLTIEEESLRNFYEKNGFQLYKESNNEVKEWLLIT